MLRSWKIFCQPILLIVLSVSTVCFGAVAQTHISDTEAVARAKRLVARMTLQEKITEIHGLYDAQHYRVIPGIPRLGIPQLNVTNGPAGVGPGNMGPDGQGSQKQATAWPAPIALAASWDTNLSHEYGKLSGEETRSLGNNFLESPDVNIARVPQGGRVFESFGEDPYLAARIAVANIEGVQSTGMIANVKHYVANNQETGRMSVDEIVDERTLHEIYMPAFEASVREAHVASVMCAYPLVNGLHDCENKPLMNDVIRKEWGFDGFITSDFGATHSTVASAMAGLDLEMPGGFFYGDAMLKAVQSGAVPVSVIDEMLVRRFSKMMEFGWFGPQPELVPIPAFEHGAIARSIAEQSMVLLKNDKNVLPIDRKAVRTVALIGPYALRTITGGGGSSHVIPMYTVTPLDGLNAALRSRTKIRLVEGNEIAEAVDAASKVDIAIVMVGDDESEGFDHSIALRDEDNKLIEAVAKANPKTIVVLKSGSAILMPWLQDVPTVLEAWYPGEEDGAAVADVLLGNVNPSGKLPLTFPRSIDDTLAKNPDQYTGDGKTVHYSEGLDVGYRGYAANGVTPLFPFGYGLSYTSFQFSYLNVTMGADKESATVSFKVSNTGQLDGAEVAELYLGFPPIADGNEPPIQLKGFSKVILKTGESKVVQLKLDPRSFSFWSVAKQDWEVAPGSFQVMVGDSSANTPLKTSINVQ
jgi:beta-glucosidase